MVERVRVQPLILAPISPSLDEERSWPKLSDIIAVQPRYHQVPGWRKKDKIWTNSGGEKFISPYNQRLKLRVLIDSHAGAAGHQGIDPKINNLLVYFNCSVMNKEVHTFVHSCLQCLSSESSRIVPLPLGNSIHGIKPNEVIHFYYCHMVPSTGSEQYVLIIKDDLTSYFWLIPCANTDLITTADSLLR